MKASGGLFLFPISSRHWSPTFTTERGTGKSEPSAIGEIGWEQESANFSHFQISRLKINTSSQNYENSLLQKLRRNVTARS